MKIASILITVIAAGALPAQDVPNLDSRIQVFAETYHPNQIIVAQAPSNVYDQPGRQTGVGVRFMGEVASHPNWYYELGGMFDASSNFAFNGNLPNGNTLSLNMVKFTDSYWSLGVGYLTRKPESLSLGLHLEARGEYLRVQGQASGNVLGTQPQNQSDTYLRPWVRGSVDYTFTGVGKDIHPYIGVDASLAILRTSQTRAPDFTNMDNRTLCALAPSYALAGYLGLRF